MSLLLEIVWAIFCFMNGYNGTESIDNLRTALSLSRSVTNDMSAQIVITWIMIWIIGVCVIEILDKILQNTISIKKALLKSQDETSVNINKKVNTQEKIKTTNTKKPNYNYYNSTMKWKCYKCGATPSLMVETCNCGTPQKDARNIYLD